MSYQLEEPSELNKRKCSLEAQEESENSQETLTQKIKKVVQSGFQVSVGIVVTSLLLSVNLIFAGKLGDTTILSGIGLANVMMNCLGSYMLQGLNQGFGSLAARAYGLNSADLLIDQTRKGFLTLCLVGIGFGIAMYCQETLLLILGQKSEVASMAGSYGINILFGMECSFVFDFIRNYLNAVDIFGVPVWIQGSQVILQWILCSITVDSMNMGVDGIALSTNLSSLIALVVMVVVQQKLKPINIFTEWRFEKVLNHYQQYCAQVFAVALPMVLDILCFEINSLFIGANLDSTAFAAHVVLCNVVSIFYCIPLGLAAAICTYISMALGKNCPKTAKSLAKIAFGLGIAEGLFFLVFFVIFGLDIGQIYTDNEEALRQFLTVLSLYEAVVILDYLQCTLQGVLKGSGLAKEGLELFAICYYVIGTPLSCFLAFYLEYGLIGFWAGFCIAIATVAISICVLLKRTDWEAQVASQHQKLIEQKRLIEDSSKTQQKEQTTPLIEMEQV